MDERLARLMDRMIEYDEHDTRRIQHFIKVHDLSATIGVLEHLDKETLFILEAAAILHDIGIHISEKKYGSGSGKYQEIEGPGEAEKLLSKSGDFTKGEIDRIKYLIAHHHTYNNIDALDYQILVEADFLVNLYENGSSTETVREVGNKIFKTEAGRRILANMFTQKC